MSEHDCGPVMRCAACTPSGAELEQRLASESQRRLDYFAYATRLENERDALKARVAELEALHAANDELVGTLQDSLNAETTRHYETAKERDGLKVAVKRVAERLRYHEFDDGVPRFKLQQDIEPFVLLDAEPPTADDPCGECGSEGDHHESCSEGDAALTTSGEAL